MSMNYKLWLFFFIAATKKFIRHISTTERRPFIAFIHIVYCTCIFIIS